MGCEGAYKGESFFFNSLFIFNITSINKNHFD